MVEHTPGPWYVEQLDGIAVCRIHDTEEDSERSWISNVYDDESWERCKANARLIAAAPELLEAAEKTPHPHLGMTEYKQQCALCAAIRKARGQS